MFWSWIAAKIFIYGARGRPSQQGPYYGIANPRIDYGPNTRTFFECPNCGMFHEEAVFIDCRFLPNVFYIEQLPCGGPTRTVVIYLDGTTEDTPAGV